MADRFPGGVISKTPPVIVAPVDGEGGSASGVWTLAEQLGLQKAGAWPQGVLPRELYAWGRSSTGQLGDGTVVSRSSPVQIGALTNWAQVSAGDYSVSGSTAAITTGGQIYSWGTGTSGQLGHNNAISLSSPVQIGALSNWAQVSTGGTAMAAVKTDGTLWTWGANNRAQLGHNNNIALSSPVQVGALINWAQVSMGSSRSCAAVKTDGTLWTWGANGVGQLGQSISYLITRSSPVQVGALTNWAQVSHKLNHMGCVKTDGTLWMWGQGAFGQLGTNSTYNRSSPVQVGALTNWNQLSVGNAHTACVTTAGTLFTWGYNGGGRLGHNNTANLSSPVQVGALTNWAQVAGGGVHTTCVKTDGTLFTWGLNTNGQLGQGNVINRSSPVQVGTLTNWMQVTASYHTAAITRG